MRIAIYLALVVALVFAVVERSSSAHADGFTVDSTADAVDADPGDGVCATADGACTLRAAVQEANALAGADTITIPAGTYALTIAGAGEDVAATGDLDVTESLSIVGEDAATTIIDGGGLDRIIETMGLTVATFELRGLTLQNGAVEGRGGALYVQSNATAVALAGVRFLDSSATVEGGGANVSGVGDGTLEIRDSAFEGNHADGSAGGLWSEWPTTIERTSLLGNSAIGGGGGAYVDASLELRDSTVADNQANDNGAGVLVRGPAMVTNVTISGNVGIEGRAGGISVGGDSVLTHVTISDNAGFGVWGTFTTVTLANSILAGNSSADCGQQATTYVQQGTNLDADGSCGTSLTADPALAPLAYWGGPPGMLTRALGSLSPAIDAAASCEANEDQRGEPRPQGAACDLGAYEATPAEAVEVVYPSGFSALGWVGGAATVEEAFADVLDQLEGVWAWDADAQEFLTWRPNVPAALNTLTTLAPGTGLWIRLADGGAASVPALGEGDAFVTGDAFGAVVVPNDRLTVGGGCTAPARTLAAGFNLVAWQGGTADAADALAGLGATLQGAWLWDGASESYLTYNPTLPPALNSLAEIRAGQSLWLRVAATTVLTGPPAC